MDPIRACRESWLEKLGHKLRALGFDPEKPPRKKFKQYEAPVLDKILEDLPEVTTDSFWNKLRTNIHNFTQITQVTQPKTLKRHPAPLSAAGHEPF